MNFTYIKLAWRNIWRNKRRTIITTASIMFAIFFALIMRSYSLGTYKNMTDSVVESYMGFIQVHAKDYWKEKTMDYLLEADDDLMKKLSSVENVKLAVPHFESFALASAGLQTKVAIVTGINPEKENQMSGLSNKMIKYRITDISLTKLAETIPTDLITKIKETRKKSFTSKEDAQKNLIKIIGKENTSKYLDSILDESEISGNYLEQNDNGVLIGDRLAKFLKLEVNDTIVLMGQGYHGVSAAGKYPIKGIIRMPNPELDNQMIYMPLALCQELYSANNLLTSISFNLKNKLELDKTKEKLVSVLNSDNYEVMTWKEMNKELVQQIESDNYSGLITLWILYIIVGFGVFGTVLMMTAERKKEFGVMVALGMQKYKLGVVVFIELIILTLIGLMAGTLLSLPIIRYFAVNPIELTGDMAEMMENFGVEPILPFAWQIDYFLAQSFSVSIVILLAIFYPLMKIFGIDTMKALRGQ